MPVETGTGAQTKFNRTRLDYPKAHWIDAACVGESGATVTLNPATKPLLIKATGHGNRRCVKANPVSVGPNKPGRIIAAKGGKSINSVMTGDLVKIIQTKGKYIGTYVSRVCSINTTTSFLDIKIKNKKASLNSKLATVIQRGDGYAYAH